MSIRLAVSQLPQMLADVVREAFAAEPDVTVEELGAGDLSAAIRLARPDVVVVGTVSDPTCELLLLHPGLVVLNLTADARTAWVCELRPHARRLGELSLDGLRTAVREALARAHPAHPDQPQPPVGGDGLG